MAQIAILGDIHANLDALNVVLDDCRAQGVSEYLCTGDVVGYNACPHECLEIIRGMGCPVMMGNHDFYVSTAQDLDDFNPHAAAVVQWTREQLSELVEESRRKNRVYTRETMMTGGPGVPGGPMMEGPDMEHDLYAQEAPDSDDMAENH